jgi:hypothetical protein
MSDTVLVEITTLDADLPVVEVAITPNLVVADVTGASTNVLALDAVVFAGLPGSPGPAGPPGAPGAPGADSTVPGPPGADGAVQEAPIDTVTYGRHGGGWTPVLAISGDVLDGGNF